MAKRYMEAVAKSVRTKRIRLVRTALFFEETQMNGLRERSGRTGVPIAELVRRAVSQLLNLGLTDATFDRWQDETFPGIHPFVLLGMTDSGVLGYLYEDTRTGRQRFITREQIEADLAMNAASVRMLREKRTAAAAGK